MAADRPEKKKAPAGEPQAIDHEKFVRDGPQKRFIEPRLLYLLREKPGYGYQLMDDMGDLPFPGPDPDSAAVYRMLRELEGQGLVRSEWKAGESGPSKRMYSITPAGRNRLDVWVAAFKDRVKMLNDFIASCEKRGD